MAWVFAYGSLMGDAVLSRYPARPARLAGYHRAFVHESRRRWGSNDHPCPILGLAKGGECWGIAYAVPADDEARVARDLAHREASAERRRVTEAVETPEGEVRAWVFVSPDKDREASEATLEVLFRAAHGTVGNGAEYVRSVVHALELHDLKDPLVDELWGRLRGS
jgi:cation transport protein ChaC